MTKKVTGDPGSIPIRPAMYRQIVEAAGFAIAIVDRDGCYLEQNPAHQLLFGYSDAELHGRTPALQLGEQQFAAIAQSLENCSEYRGEVVGSTRTRRLVRILLHAFCVCDADGSPEAYAFVHRDVTSRTRGGPDLQRTVSLLRAALESTADGLLIADTVGSMVTYNARFATMWRIPQGILHRRDDEEILAFMASQVSEVAGYERRLAEVQNDPAREGCDLINFKDGRVFERYSLPHKLDNRVIGTVWSFRDVTAKFRTESALREGELRYRMLFENSRQAIYVTTRDGTFVDINTAALELLGYTRADMLRLDVSAVYVDPSDGVRFQETTEEHGFIRDFETQLRRGDGTTLDCVLTAAVRRDANGEVVGYQGIIQDISERKRAEAALRTSEQYFRALIENALDTITLLRADGTITYESPSLDRVLGYGPEELVGAPVFEYIHPDDLPEVLSQFQLMIEQPLATAFVETRFRHRDGSWRTLEAIGRNLLHHPAVGSIVVNARDVTERKRAEEQLLFDAFHDKLTGLANRALLMDRLGQLLKRARRSPQIPFAVLFLDVDQFKLVNDSLGHVIGDKLLVALSSRLESRMRPGDTLARLGGDEFTILLDSPAGLGGAMAVATRLHEGLEEPFDIDGYEVYVTMSIGIAMSTGEYARAEDLLRDADIAMYRAKALGRGLHQVFDSAMHDRAVAHLRLETDLRRAVERTELRLHYQPVVSLESGELVGFESLLRWQHSSGQLLQPGEFLPVAEESGLIVPVSWWVLGEACRQVVEWNRLRSGKLPLQVYVNLSGKQLAQMDLVDRINNLLEETGAKGCNLKLELTEGSLIDNAETTALTLSRLKSLGIGVAIDDFGTGYSSLSYLQRFPTATLKIDRSFVSRIGDNGTNSEIARSIVSLGRDLNMDVVAEGIETQAQYALLRELGCKYGQGFLFARPMPGNEAGSLVLQGRTWSCARS